MNKKRRGARGFTLIEVMIAGGITMIVLGASLTLLNYYTGVLTSMQQRSVYQSIRANVLQNLNRPDAWVITYRYGEINGNFRCLLNPDLYSCPSPATSAIPPDPPNLRLAAVNGSGINDPGYPFNVFGRYLDPADGSGINASDPHPENYTPIRADKIVNTLDGEIGFTTRGAKCNTFPSKACPIRLITTWELMSMGGEAYPTGYYFAYGYAQTAYLPTSGIPTGESAYGFFGYMPAQVKVVGTFFYNDDDNVLTNVLPSSYKRIRAFDFTLIKEVP